MYTNRLNPRASVLECCSPLQLSRTVVYANKSQLITYNSPHDRLISRLVTLGLVSFI
jgi:hypothetical protein